MTDLTSTITDLSDMGTVMQAIATSPSVKAGYSFWMEVPDFFMGNEKAIGLFMFGCGIVRSKCSGCSISWPKRMG